MKEAVLFFGDIHFGAHKNHEFVLRSFEALKAFFKERYIHIFQAVDLGDTYENWEPLEEYVNPFGQEKIIQDSRAMYRHIFEERKPNIIAFPGNHTTHAIEGEINPEKAFSNNLQAADDLCLFLKDKVFDGKQADIETFAGIHRFDEDVLAHHGDILDTLTFKSVMDQLDPSMTVEQKMAIINSSRELYTAVQRIWQKFLPWWKRLFTKLPKNGLPFYYGYKRFRAYKNERKINERTKEDRKRNPLTQEVKNQFRLLKHLCPKKTKKKAIVAGHTHLPGAVSNIGPHKGSVITTGSWHVSLNSPVVAIHLNEEDGKKFLLAEYNPVVGEDEKGKWAIRDEVLMR